MSNKMWSFRRLRGADYAIIYDGAEVGVIGSKASVERLVAAANACAMVPAIALKDLDVERLRQACKLAREALEKASPHIKSDHVMHLIIRAREALEAAIASAESNEAAE